MKQSLKLIYAFMVIGLNISENVSRELCKLKKFFKKTLDLHAACRSIVYLEVIIDVDVERCM